MPTNAPISYAMLYVRAGRVGGVEQECVYTSRTDFRHYYRYYDGTTWGDWKRVYDETILTDSTILSPLASALGGAVKSIANNTDLNSITTPGEYYCPNGNTTATLANKPSSVVYGFNLKVSIMAASGTLSQYLTSYNRYYGRFKDGNSWSDWVEMYNESMLTNSSLLSPLASALGVQDTLRNGDLNDLTVSGTWRTISCTNAPTAYGFTKVVAVGGDIRQEFYNIFDSNITPSDTPNTYMRSYVNGAWTAWVKIATV